MGEYLSNHHERQQEIYKVVPRVAGEIIDYFPELLGMTFGGSYAARKYREGEDVDIDLLFQSSPNLGRLEQIREEIEAMFLGEGVTAHIRAPLAMDSIPRSMRVTLYGHPNTPFVARNEQVARDWGLK